MLEIHTYIHTLLYLSSYFRVAYTPNANMADLSVGARDKFHERDVYKTWTGVHGPPHGPGSWSMDPGPCFVYVPMKARLVRPLCFVFDNASPEKSCFVDLVCRSGGGVCIYLRSNINYQIRDDLCDDHLECVVIEIIRPHSKPFIVSTWYKPPNSPQDIFRQFESLIDKVDSEQKDFYLLGDLNCNICKTDQIITHLL